MRKFLFIFTVLLLLAGMGISQSIQADTVISKKENPQPVSKHSPSKAAIRSALLPGLGQAYNKKYWKIPIVYGALAVPVYTYVYNKNWYDKTREAYEIKFYNDTSRYDEIDDQLKPLSEESLRAYRNEFRQSMDISILAFIIVWGLNVVDAAVDAHLKDFDISDNLSMKISPGHSEMAGTNGVSLILKIGPHGRTTK
jgi:Family of unknown function (DUF5683)